MYFTADDAADAAAEGAKVILVRNETSPEDVHGMQASQGILTSRGGLVSHAAVVARSWEHPGRRGCREREDLGQGLHRRRGDGGRGRRDLHRRHHRRGGAGRGGRLSTSEAPPEAGDAAAWPTASAAARTPRRARLGVRANADTGADAALARAYGAEGIGLCRTEHMFLGDDRLPVVREMILADTPEAEEAALDKLLAVQRADFVEVLEAMDGLPVTVRLLDPPLHEFLPQVECVVRQAQGKLSGDDQALLAAARSWHEQNPMLGTAASAWAWSSRASTPCRSRHGRGRARAGQGRGPAGRRDHDPAHRHPGGDGGGAQLGHRGHRRGHEGARRRLDITIGTMIETPRAAVRADEIAEVSDFSFGTNDLTQMAFGFSRDDVESRVMPLYLQHGLLRRNPFETIDVDGVGDLVAVAVEQGRSTNRSLKLGVCGEHGGDPQSIAFFQRVGLDYVVLALPGADRPAGRRPGHRRRRRVALSRRPPAAHHRPPRVRGSSPGVGRLQRTEGVALNVDHRQYGRAGCPPHRPGDRRPSWRARPSAGSPQPEVTRVPIVARRAGPGVVVVLRRQLRQLRGRSLDLGGVPGLRYRAAVADLLLVHRKPHAPTQGSGRRVGGVDHARRGAGA